MRASVTSDPSAFASKAAPGAPYHFVGTSDPSSLWAFGFHRATRLGGYHELARTLASDASQALVLAAGRFWSERKSGTEVVTPADAAVLDRVRVLWERRMGGATWHLLTNAPP